MDYKHTIEIVSRNIQDLESLVNEFLEKETIPAIDIDLALGAIEILCQQLSHRRDVRRHLRCLRDDGDIGIAKTIGLAVEQTPDLAQKLAAVAILVLRIVIGKKAADVALADGAQQGIA